MANTHLRFGRHAVVCAAAIAAMVYLTAGASLATAKGKKNNNGQAPTSQPMNPQLMVAAQNLQTAQHALAAATEEFKKKYEVTDQWKSAADAQANAQKALNREHESVIEKLADTDAYKEVVNKKAQASADLQAAHDDPTDADPQHTADLAAAVMQATQDKSKLENDALANDSGYAAAQAKLSDADKAMGELQEQEKTAMQQDPDWQKAHTSLVSAQAAYDKLVG